MINFSPYGYVQVASISMKVIGCIIYLCLSRTIPLSPSPPYAEPQEADLNGQHNPSLFVL